MANRSWGESLPASVGPDLMSMYVERDRGKRRCVRQRSESLADFDRIDGFARATHAVVFSGNLLEDFV